MSATQPVESCAPGVDLKAFWSVSYGLYVCSTRAGEKRNGCIVNAFGQVAEDPCVATVSLNKKNLTHDMIMASRAFTVQVLEKETPLEFVGIFGFRTGRKFDKLGKAKYRDGVTGSPIVLEHTLASFEAKVKQTIDCGSHTVFVGEVVKAERLAEGEPLTYAHYVKVKGGKTGKNAPGYAASLARQEPKERRQEMKKYVCSVCGYVYDPDKGDPDNGVDPGTLFEKLPDDWVCPVCGASKDQFEPE